MKITRKPIGTFQNVEAAQNYALRLSNINFGLSIVVTYDYIGRYIVKIAPEVPSYSPIFIAGHFFKGKRVKSSGRYCS